MPRLIRILAVDLFRRPVRTRLPFRFGAVTLRDLTQLTARVRIDDGQGHHTGHAADLAVPRWFRKDPSRTTDEDVRGLIASARAAAAAWLGHGASPRPVFDTWWDVYGAGVDSLPPADPGRLERTFGIALVERAILDATCRGSSMSLFEALERDLFGFCPGRVLGELRSYDLAADLPRAPLHHVTVRHTIGMLDPLCADDATSDLRLGDGLPETLEEYAGAQGLTHFKIKIGQGVGADFARLVGIARVLRGQVARPSITVDGNEQYEHTDEILRLLDRTARDPDGAWLLDGLLYVEQPLRRDLTFDPGRHASLLSAPAPFVIDEADVGVDAYARAWDLGYRGVSAKSCKGVFRALLNRGVARVRGGFQCAEDLTTLPTVALEQDLALIAALGIEHAERNGHHYFRGLDHLSEAERAHALAAHPDLYERWEGGVRVAIDSGRVSIASLANGGLGTMTEPDLGRHDLLPGR